MGCEEASERERETEKKNGKKGVRLEEEVEVKAVTARASEKQRVRGRRKHRGTEEWESLRGGIRLAGLKHWD